jgi:hypothetical protein
VNNQDINSVTSAHTWFLGLTTKLRLITGGVELNLGPQLEEELMDFMVE